jgi:hypothetical protein
LNARARDGDIPTKLQKLQDRHWADGTRAKTLNDPYARVYAQRGEVKGSRRMAKDVSIAREPAALRTFRAGRIEPRFPSSPLHGGDVVGITDTIVRGVLSSVMASDSGNLIHDQRVIPVIAGNCWALRPLPE